MKKIISNLDKSVTSELRLSYSEGIWRSDRSDGSYDLWGGDEANVLLRQIYYWPQDPGAPPLLWPYYFIEERRCDRQWYRHVNTRIPALTLVLEGYIEFSEDNHVTVVGPGEVMFESIGSSCRIINADDRPSHKLVILFTPRSQLLLDSMPGLCPNGKLLIKESGVIEKKMRQIGRIIKQKRKEDEYLLSEKAYNLLLELLRLRKETFLPEPLKKIFQIMEKHDYMIGGINLLAGETGISASTILRLFKKHLGCTPYAFMLKKRLEQGAALLAAGKNVKETASCCGFADAAHFSRAFKKQFAVSPAEYKARSLHGGAIAKTPDVQTVF